MRKPCRLGAARLVVDCDMHAKRWSFEQAVNFMMENTGMPADMLHGEVSRTISVPDQATAHYIGYTQIMAARQRAMDTLADQFDLKQFHNVILGSGAMPLDETNQVIDQYIQSKVNGG
jgi:uncharacterized protein (DUF885 family)